jgi:hypothetical protein
MLDIGTQLGTKLPQKAVSEQAVRVHPAASTPKTATKAGAIIVLSPTALKLSRDLQAIQSNPDMEPTARADASAQLRQLALKVFSGE